MSSGHAVRLALVFALTVGGWRRVCLGAVAGGRHFTDIYRNSLEHMAHMLDAATEPCDDFYQHACGLLDGRGATAAAAATVEVPPFLYNRQDRLQFFEKSKAQFGTRPGGLLAELYDSCKRAQRSNSRSRWLRMLREIEFLARDRAVLAQWPFLRHEWEQYEQQAQPSWATLAAEWAAHGISSLFRIFFADATIYVAPVDGFACPSLAEFAASLLPFLRQRNSQIAHVIGHELWTFCRQLSGETTPSTDLMLEKNTTDLFVDEAARAYLQRFFTRLNFSASEVEAARKTTINSIRLTEVFALLRNVEPRVTLNFVLWRALQNLRYEDCYLLVEEFEEVLLSEYWSWHVFSSYYSREVALASYLFQTTRFQRYRRETLMGSQWDRFLETKFQRKDFNVARMIKSYANTFLDPKKLNASYSVGDQEGGVFYAHLLELRRLQLRRSFEVPYVDDEDANHPRYFLREFLNYCILILHRPPFHYFASQGRHLWERSKLLESSDGFYTALDCLERQSHLYSDDAPLFAALSEEQVEHIFRFYSAFVESLRDYRFWLEGENFAIAEDYVLEYFQMGSDRIMFYAVAHMYCRRNGVLYRPLINRSFMNVPDFQEAFNCSATAPMNPPTKCLIKSC